MADGKTPLFRDVNSTRKIAKEAVKRSTSTSGHRRTLPIWSNGRRWRFASARKYGSDVNGAPNVNPFFVGVFDTVASLGSYRAAFLALAGWLIFLAIVSAIVSFGQSFFPISFWPTFWALVALSILVASIWYVIAHLQYAVGLDGYSFWQTLHFTAPKMQFYDKHLDNAVWYARHALSIDENRADFARVEWGSSTNAGPPRPDSYPDWLDQIWFAGVHSDIGGGYDENESRLSDITVEWMLHAAENLPDEKTPNGNGIKVDRSYLQLNLRLGWTTARRSRARLFLGNVEVDQGAAEDRFRRDLASVSLRPVRRGRGPTLL